MMKPPTEPNRRQFPKETRAFVTIQMIARFNYNRGTPEYRPAQTPLCEFYSVARY
jgi:hypothetical protein